MVDLGEELVSPSPIRPKQKVLQIMPASPQPQGEQMADFGYAERDLLAGRFFLLSTQHGQHGQGEHGQSNVSIPALPMTDFVMIQSAFPFGHLESALDGRALSGYGHQGFQSALLLARIGEIEGVLGLGLQAAPYQQRMLPSLTLRLRTC